MPDKSIFIDLHCPECDGHLQAYACDLEIALQSLDAMKVELQDHFDNDHKIGDE